MQMKKMDKKSAGTVGISETVVFRERLSWVRLSTSQTVANMWWSVRVCQVTVHHSVCMHTVWGGDMCYFACKFFSDSPPSEPAESDSGAGLKTEVCFYD